MVTTVARPGHPVLGVLETDLMEMVEMITIKVLKGQRFSQCSRIRANRNR